jgi:hypothetical protein
MDTEQKASHTPEPWKRGEYGGIYPANGGAGIVSAYTPSGFLPNHVENESRIVACVNACVGLDTDDLIGSDGAMTESLLNSVKYYKQQRDELLAAASVYATKYLEDEYDSAEHCINNEHHDDVVRLFKAIAKAVSNG